MPRTKTTKKDTRPATKKTSAKTSAKKTTKKPAGAKKTTNKKPTTKKSRSASQPERFLIVAEGPVAFWVSDGQVLTSLADLHQALDAMSDDTFYYHALGEQNDFATWIDEVLCDSNCAQALGNIDDRPTAITVIEQYLSTYKL